MKKCIALLFSLITVLGVSAQGVVGDWSGKLNVAPQMSLKLVFHISPESKVTMDSPDQGAYGIEGEVLYLSADSISFKVPSLMMDFTGHLSGGNIDGTFRQMGRTIPLILVPGEKKANRPQTPKAPFPYSTESVIVNNGYVKLAGTLTIPENADASTPVVVMVSGSGQHNRDEELFEHKPFAVIADYLARNGIASLRYDDRGVGESTGDILSATTADFAEDAQSMVEYVRNSKRFGKIGMLGHSEGGIIAYMSGAKPGMLDYIVSIAGPSVKGTKTIAYQNRVALRKSGVAEDVAKDFEKAIEAVFEYKLAHPEAIEVSEELIARLYPQYGDTEETRRLGGMLKSVLSAAFSNPWMEYFLAYDPAADLKALAIPAFIIYGEKDSQVPPSLNAAPAQRLAKNAKVTEYAGLNHIMQHAGTGYVEEYAAIEETISPEVLADIAGFITGGI